MIDKYQNSEIKYLWSDENKFSLMETIELYWLEGISSHLNIEINTNISSNLDIKKIKNIEKERKHEVVSFLQEMEERLTDTAAKKYLHYNLTSSDLLDTVSTFQHKYSFDVFKYLYYELNKTIDVLILDQNYRDIKQIGRTHGRYAEEIDFVSRFQNLKLGIKHSFLSLYEIMHNLPGKLSGPVGHTKVPQEVLQNTAGKMDLKLSPYKMQIIPRQLYSEITFHLCNLATWYEKFCTDLRLLSFNEVNEMQEGFDSKQWGSSAMPHKKNPIISERICGLSRLLRQSLSTALENNITWLERDISHSSTERLNWENQWHLICHITQLMNKLVTGLQINLNNIERNLKNATMSVDTLNANIAIYSGRTEAYEKTKKSINGPKTDVQAKNVDLYGLPTLQRKT